MAVLRTENPVGFLHSAKVTRHGFEIVAIETIDLESLARNAKSSPGKILLNEVRRTTQARGIIPEIALFEGECFRDLKEASCKIAGLSRRQVFHSDKCI